MDVFVALADPTRRGILELLSAEGQLPATDIGLRFPVSAPAISQHLKALREANLVTMEKRAQQRLYQLNAPTLATVALWVSTTTREWNSRLDRLEDALRTNTETEGEKNDQT
jgi:DNA-binding transcriptional ArsR family regulator